MAKLYLARQPGIGGFSRHVVLKCIRSELASDDAMRTMFLDEARLAGLLTHPNIVQIYEIGEEDETFFISMEYIHGLDLRQLGKKLHEQAQPSPHHFSLLAGIFAQAARGLHHAHEATDEYGNPLRLVHRDISPTNILLSYKGNVKLVDFGVAKATTQQHQTGVGSFKGKLSYMSPEHANGETLDRRSDLFAMGVVLYEVSTHHSLFARKTPLETILAVDRAPIIPPRELVPGYPAELERIVMKALQRNRETRYQTAQEICEDLDEFMTSSGKYCGDHQLAQWLETLYPNKDARELPKPPASMSHAPPQKNDASFPYPGKQTRPLEPYVQKNRRAATLDMKAMGSGTPSSYSSSREQSSNPSIRRKTPSSFQNHQTPGSLLVNTPSQSLLSSGTPIPSSHSQQFGTPVPGSQSHHGTTPSPMSAEYQMPNPPTTKKSGNWLIILALLFLVLAGCVFVFWPNKEASLTDQEKIEVIEEYIKKQQYGKAKRQLALFQQDKSQNSTGPAAAQFNARLSQLKHRIQIAPKLVVIQQLIEDDELKKAAKTLRKLKKRYPTELQFKQLYKKVKFLQYQKKHK